ncbi:MAG: amidophosphoribosyltransferase [Syntrophomonadaceae bacterium]|nr:amidophosphoribosyltransferase [Syntrophomonadaceae bacterium]
MFDEVKDKFRDECGVFGIYLNKTVYPDEAARNSFYGLYALQHRGQESCGLAISNGEHILLRKGMGLVSDVINQEVIEDLPGHLAIGHVRYSTAGYGGIVNTQPLVIQYLQGSMALAYNGSITNARQLRHRLAEGGAVFQTTSDAEIVALLLARYAKDCLENALAKTMVDIEGALAMVIMTETKLIGVRDPWGIRPLCIGELNGDYILASESSALDTIGARLVRDVEPGEIVAIDRNGLRSMQTVKPQGKAHCIFEYIYFARPDSTIDGINVTYARRELGKQLARECPVEADIVISVPDSGTSAALGYAEHSGIPFQQGLLKNRYVGRTFIQPTQQMREMGVRLKLNPIREIVEGKRVIMVDDSIVRGTTSRNIVNLLRRAGASEVHMMVSSPPTKHPCYYGIDTSSREELIANRMTPAQICQYIGADSLYHISEQGMYEALGGNGNIFCTACFTGSYPVKIS